MLPLLSQCSLCIVSILHRILYWLLYFCYIDWHWMKHWLLLCIVWQIYGICMKIRQRNSLRFIKRFVSINSLLPSLKLNCMRATTCHRIQSIFSLVLRHKMKRISNFSYFEQFFFLVSQCKYKVGILCTQKETFLCSKKNMQMEKQHAKHK